MRATLNQVHLMIVCNTVTSIITCFPNWNPWPYGIDFHAALLLLHRAGANIWWIGLKINALSTVWLIHGLSGVITVPSTTMSQARRGEDVLSRCREMNELTLSNGRNMLKYVPLKRAESWTLKDTWAYSEAVAMGHLIINLINRHLWRGLALTLSNYHSALWWSIWVKSFGQASWHWAPRFSLLWKRNQREALSCWAVTWDLRPGLT